MDGFTRITQEDQLEKESSVIVVGEDLGVARHQKYWCPLKLTSGIFPPALFTALFSASSEDSRLIRHIQMQRVKMTRETVGDGGVPSEEQKGTFVPFSISRTDQGL